MTRLVTDSLGSITVSGIVKWYDWYKGYGFIQTGDVQGDVLLYGKLLQSSGYGRFVKGLDITVVAEENPNKRGWLAVSIIQMDKEASQRPFIHMSNNIEKLSTWEEAKVKTFNVDDGYGFVTVESCTRDIFLHMDTVRQGRLTGIPLVGQAFLIRYGQSGNGKGLRAFDIRQ